MAYKDPAKAKEYGIKWRKEHPNAHREYWKKFHKKYPEWRQTNAAINRAWVYNYKLKNPCVDCGETDPIVLDFDHRDRKTKLSNIASMISSHSLNSIKIEASKCDIRCANCHRRKTWGENNARAVTFSS